MAAGMREVPTFAIAERVIEQDYKVRLPDRRFIRLWNTPEISQFRGYQEDLDEAEEGRAQHAREQMEIQQAARETGASAPDMGVVHEMLSHQRQQQEAMRAHVEDLNRIQREHMEGMRVEQQAELERLAASQQEAARRAAMAEQALVHLRDINLEHRSMISEMAARTGVVHQNFDQRQTVINNNQFVQENVHNQALALMNSHRAEFGEYMRQHQLSAERMQQLLFMHLLQREQQGPTIHFVPQPVPVPFPIPQGSSEPLDIVQQTGGGPPPAPPGGGMIAVPTPQPKRQPRRRALPYPGGAPPPPGPSPEVPPALRPDPIAIPSIPEGVIHHRMDTPRVRRPRAKAAARTATPWRSGEANPDPLPATGPNAPKMPAEEEAAAAPVAAAPKAKAQPKRRARSASVASTVLYPENMDQPPPRTRARTRSASVASTIAYDESGQPAPKRRGRPPKEEGDTLEPIKPEPKKKKTELNVSAIANAAKFSRPKAKAKAAPRRTVTIKVPEGAAPPDGKPRVRKVTITSVPPTRGVPPKRGRGRPKGSKNKKTLERERLIEEESARLDAVQL